MLSLAQAPFADSDDFLGVVDQPDKGRDQRLAVHNLLFSERYLKGALRICVEFTDGLGEKFRAVFQRKLPISGSNSDARERDFFSVRHFDRGCNGNVAVSNTGRYEGLVLVQDIKALEDEYVPVASIVWLEKPNEAGRPFADAVYSSFCAPGHKFLGGAANGKPTLSFDLPVVRSDQGTKHKVEVCPEIVDGVANEATPHGRNSSESGNAVVIPLGFSVFLSDEGYGVSVDETLDLAVQVSDVLLGPLDFQFRPQEQIC